MVISHNGTCRKCKERRDKGSHKKCDRWPTANGVGKGFKYIGNADETNVEEFKRVVSILTQGESDDTPVQFEIRIRQVEQR
jgi:hypothetical protein